MSRDSPGRCARRSPRWRVEPGTGPSSPAAACTPRTPPSVPTSRPRCCRPWWETTPPTRPTVRRRSPARRLRARRWATGCSSRVPVSSAARGITPVAPGGGWPARPAGPLGPCSSPTAWSSRRRWSTCATWPVGCSAPPPPAPRAATTPSVRSGRSAAGSSSPTVAAHTADVVPVAPGWLLEQGVTWWSGPASLPMWLGERGYEGFMTRTGAGAVAAGLRHRPTEEVLVDTLAWEREQGLGRARPAGLSGRREQELLSAWAARR